MDKTTATPEPVTHTMPFGGEKPVTPPVPTEGVHITPVPPVNAEGFNVL